MTFYIIKQRFLVFVSHFNDNGVNLIMIQTWGLKMEGADESAGLWRLQCLQLNSNKGSQKLSFKPGVSRWKAQMNPLGYGACNVYNWTPIRLVKSYDSNQGSQDGRCRWIRWAMGTCNVCNWTPIRGVKSVILNSTSNVLLLVQTRLRKNTLVWATDRHSIHNVNLCTFY